MITNQGFTDCSTDFRAVQMKSVGHTESSVDFWVIDMKNQNVMICHHILPDKSFSESSKTSPKSSEDNPDEDDDENSDENFNEENVQFNGEIESEQEAPDDTITEKDRYCSVNKRTGSGNLFISTSKFE